MDKHHIKPFALAWLLALVSLTAAAQKNRLTVDDVQLSAGSETAIHVSMDNTRDIVGVQFTLTLPGGFSLDIPSLIPTERVANHKVTVRKTGNYEYMFIVYSSSNQPISSIGGELFAITLKAAGSVAGGKTYDMALSDVVMSLRGGENVVEETVPGHIVVKDLPNLHVVAVDCSEAVAGKDITIQWTVRNDGGDTESQEWKDYVWLMPDIMVGDNTTGYRLLATLDNPVGLDAGDSYDNSVTVRLPERIYGSYDIVVCSDMYDVASIDLSPTGGELPRPYEPETSSYGFLYASTHGNHNHVSEEGESRGRSDNFFYRQIDIGVPPLPDLVVGSVTVSNYTITEAKDAPAHSDQGGAKIPTISGSQFFSGSSVLVEAIITNKGDASMKEKTVVRNAVYISHSPDPEAETLHPLYGYSITNDTIWLGARESMIWAGIVVIPKRWYGDVYFHVQSDVLDAVYENANLGNNLGCSDMIHVLPCPSPDYVVESASAPAIVTAGEPFKLDYKVKNLGVTFYSNIIKAETGTNKVFVTPHGSPLTDTSPSVGEGGYSLQHDWFFNKPINVTLKNCTPGAYDLYLKLDADDDVFEYEGEDNNTYGPITVQVVQTDLTAQLLTVSADTLASHAKVAFSWKVTNHGEGELENRILTDRFYAAKNANGTDTIFIGEAFNTVTLPSGAEKTLMANIFVPSDERLTGYRYVFVTTNANKRIEESDTINNNSDKKRKYFLYTDEPQPTPTDSRPNLMVSTLTVPATITPGGQVTLSYVVTNSGLSAVDKDVRQEVYVSKKYPVTSGGQFSLSGATPCTLSSQQAAVNGLGAGKKKTIRVTATMPDDVKGGSCYLIVVLNRDGMLSETQSKDNNASKQTYMDGNLPDLVIQDIHVPASVITSTPTEVTWSLCNNGSWRAEENTVQVYLSSNGSKKDLLLATLNTSWLSKGESVTMRTNLDIPDDKPGDWFLLLVTNPKKEMEELSADNNTAAAPLHVVQAPLPDLKVTLNSIEGRCRGGDILTVTAKVSNVGDDITHINKWADAVYVTNGYTLTGRDFPLASKAHVGKVAVGEGYNLTLQVKLPDDLSGYQVLHVCADHRGAMVDKNRSSNTAWQTLVVEPRQGEPADLEVAKVSTSAHITAGTPVTIDYEVTNNGSFVADGTLHDAIYLSTDNRWDVNDILVGTVEGKVSILPGQTIVRHATGRIANVVEGRYHVIIRTNTTHVIFENDYDNNDGVQVSASAIEFAMLQPGASVTVNTAGYYKVPIQEEGTTSTLALQLKSHGYSQAGLYVSYEAVPTTARYDLGTADWRSNDQQLILPHTQEGTYYVLAQANAYSGQGLFDFTLDDETAASQVSMTLSAQEIPFGASRLSVTEGGKDGWVTTGVQGALLDSIMDFRLVQGDMVIPTEHLVFHNSSSTNVTFNLDQVDLGTYDLLAELPDGTQATLKNAFRVVPTTYQGLGVKIQAPGSMRIGDNATIDISYSNTGTRDIIVRGFIFVTEKGVLATSFVGSQKGWNKEVSLFPNEQQNARGYFSIPPGAQGTLRCYFNTDLGLNRLYLYLVK